MTRPPGASFAQFFPTAPKVKAQAQSRADSDRPKTGATIADSLLPGTATASDSVANGSVRPLPGQNGIPTDVAHSLIDDNDSPAADIPSTVGSSSSHSTASSSVFSTSARQAATAASSRLPTSSVTPVASKDSPSYSSAPASTKLDMSASQTADRATPQPSQNPLTTHRNGSLSIEPLPIERVPARDPMPSVKGIKCTYDPLLDRVHNKHVSRNAKPTYKEFGLVCVNKSPCGGVSSSGV